MLRIYRQPGAVLVQLCFSVLLGLRTVSGRAQHPAPAVMSSSAVTPAISWSLLAITKKNHSGIKCDLYCCSCHQSKAFCTGSQRRLHYLPRVPPNIREFRMMLADLQVLTRAMLANLSNFEVVHLNLTSNNISSITSDAFADFPQLKYLCLSNNTVPVPDLQAAFHSIPSTSMTSLYLDDMQLGDLPADFFAAPALDGARLSVLNLVSNHLTVFNTAVFRLFQKIRALHLSQNKIGALTLDARANISSLRLSDNGVRVLPDFCLPQGDSPAIHNLLGLYLQNNELQSIPRGLLRGRCLPHLAKLDISGLRLTKLEDDFIADLPKLESLTVCDSTSLARYEPRAFRSASLQSLLLCNNNKRLDPGSLDVDHAFHHCPNLTQLRIVNMKIEMRDEAVRRMLLPLTSVQHLALETTSLGNIPEDTLWRLPHLKTLTFRGNHLDPFRLGLALKNVTNLDYLSLQGNSISIVNESTLPWEFRQSLGRIDLSRNPFLCSCDLLWFRTWLEGVTLNKTVHVVSYPSSQYSCFAPVSMRNVILADFRPTSESCDVRRAGLVLLGVLVGAVLVTLTSAAILCYRYRWYLRFFLYRLRRRTKNRLIRNADAEEAGEGVPLFNYDVYLAHSAKDIEWVHGELLPLLEGEHRLRVFLEERDTQGGTVADNIARYMECSARVVLVVSASYVQEEWRQYEFQHVLLAAIEDHKDVVLLLLGDVPAGSMTRDMRRMLTRGTFLQWGDSEEARKNFRDGLKVAIDTQGPVLDAVC